MRFKQFLTVFAFLSVIALADDEPKKVESPKPKEVVIYNSQQTKNTDAEQTLAIKKCLH